MILNEEQQQILVWFSQGQRAKEVGRRLDLDTRVVERRCNVIRRRLGALTMAHAVAIAISGQLIFPAPGVPCPMCGGSGRCGTCGGSGRIAG